MNLGVRIYMLAQESFFEFYTIHRHILIFVLKPKTKSLNNSWHHLFSTWSSSFCLRSSLPRCCRVLLGPPPHVATYTRTGKSRPRERLEEPLETKLYRMLRFLQNSVTLPVSACLTSKLYFTNFCIQWLTLFGGLGSIRVASFEGTIVGGISAIT